HVILQRRRPSHRVDFEGDPRRSIDRLECINRKQENRVISRVSACFLGMSRLRSHICHIFRGSGAGCALSGPSAWPHLRPPARPPARRPARRVLAPLVREDFSRSGGLLRLESPPISEFSSRTSAALTRRGPHAEGSSRTSAALTRRGPHAEG